MQVRQLAGQGEHEEARFRTNPLWQATHAVLVVEAHVAQLAGPPLAGQLA